MPRTVRPSSPRVDLAAHPGQQVAQGVAGLGGLVRPAGHGRRSHPCRGEGQERARRWTGRARSTVSMAVTGAGGDPPAVRARRRRRRRRGDAAARRSSRCAAWTAPACRRAARRRPCRSARPRAAAPRRTARTPRRRSTTCPPGTRPSPRTTNGRAPRPSSSTVTPRPRSAVSTSPTGRCAHVRVAVEGHRPGGQRRDRRHEPQHRAGESAVDLRVAVERPRASPPSRRRRCRPRPRARTAPTPSARCRATAGPGVRRRVRRPGRRSPARGWSGTCCPAARPRRRPVRARGRRPRVDVRHHPAQPSRLSSVVEVRGASATSLETTRASSEVSRLASSHPRPTERVATSGGASSPCRRSAARRPLRRRSRRRRPRPACSPRSPARSRSRRARSCRTSGCRSGS